MRDRLTKGGNHNISQNDNLVALNQPNLLSDMVSKEALISTFIFVPAPKRPWEMVESYPKCGNSNLFCKRMF